MSEPYSALFHRFYSGWLKLPTDGGQQLQAMKWASAYKRLTAEEIKALLREYSGVEEHQVNLMDKGDLRSTLYQELATALRGESISRNAAERHLRRARQGQEASGADDTTSEDTSDTGEESGQAESEEEDDSPKPRGAGEQEIEEEHVSAAADDGTAASEDDSHEDQLSDEEQEESERVGHKRKSRGARAARVPTRAKAASAAAGKGQSTIAKLRARLAERDRELAKARKALSAATGHAAASAAAPSDTASSSGSVRPVGKCKRMQASRESRTRRPYAPPASSDGLPRLVRTMLDMVARRVTDRPASRTLPDKVAEDWLKEQVGSWGGIAERLGSFQTRARMLDEEPWYSRVGAVEVGTVLGKELMGSILTSRNFRAAMARMRKALDAEVSWSMVKGTPAYAAVVAACVGEGSAGLYRIFPGTADDLEHTGLDPALVPADEPLTEAKMDVLCRTALQHLDSMKALDADALMQQAVVVVMLFAAAERSASSYRGRQAELAYEYTLRRALFHYELTAMKRHERKRLERMALSRLEYRSWQHRYNEGRDRSHDDHREHHVRSTSSEHQEEGRWKSGRFKPGREEGRQEKGSRPEWVSKPSQPPAVPAPARKLSEE